MIIEEFKEKHIEDAAKLFQKNYSDINDRYTFLPGKFMNIDTISFYLKEIISENPSFVAIGSNKIVGYMTGYSNIKELKGSFSGSYTPEWGHSAIFDDRENIYENLYTTISGVWAENDNFTHIISFLVNTELINTFSMLGFGMQLIDAIKDPNITRPIISSPYKIERANESHISQLKEFNVLINKHLESPPIFLKRNTKEKDDDQIINEFLSEDKITLVATKENEIISCISGIKNDGNIPILDEKGTFGINFGYTRSDYRKTGIASILLNEIVKIAKDDDTVCCSVDFETQNIEGRNFWLKHFKPVVYSMMRKIDDRIKY